MIDGRLLYFPQDVIDEVYERFKGEYTKEQIWDIFDASISYLHYIMRETDTLSVYIRYIGYMTANRVDMENLAGRLGEDRQEEKDSLLKKVERIKKEFGYFRPLSTDIPVSITRLRRGKKWNYIQKLQNNLRF